MLSTVAARISSCNEFRSTDIGGSLSAMPRKEPNRVTDSAVLVRLTTAEREHMDKAIAQMLQDAGIPGAKLTIGKFFLMAALDKADLVLNEAEAKRREEQMRLVKMTRGIVGPDDSPEVTAEKLHAWENRTRAAGIKSIDEQNARKKR
jgi:hypothetical protein